MSEKTVSIGDAKTQLSRPIAGIVIARAGTPVAELRTARNVKKRSGPIADPLLRVEGYSCDDPIGPTANEYIDRTVYGI